MAFTHLSELIALSRVLVSIMAHPACQKRVQSAVEKVRSATRELLEHAKADAFNQFALTGTAEHYAQMHKNALMAEMALKQLLNQTVA
uniref:Focal_AT domain-containing protein n=1 Tax=Globodera pallida TaxID=36090 RepID=A0A183CLJ1_GLOPA